MPSSFQSLARRLAPMGIFCCLVIVLLGSLRSVPVIASNTTTLSDESTTLPEWLTTLELTPLQIRQVLGIDTVLHQQIRAILTTQQYNKLQTFMDENESQQLNIHDVDLDLSLYQQAALNTAFEEAITSLINILSLEQKQLFFYNLENHSPVESDIPIEI